MLWVAMVLVGRLGFRGRAGWSKVGEVDGLVVEVDVSGNLADYRLNKGFKLGWSHG